MDGYLWANLQAMSSTASQAECFLLDQLQVKSRIHDKHDLHLELREKSRCELKVLADHRDALTDVLT